MTTSSSRSAGTRCGWREDASGAIGLVEAQAITDARPTPTADHVRDRLRDLLVGRSTRAEVARWARRCSKTMLDTDGDANVMTDGERPPPTKHQRRLAKVLRALVQADYR